MIMMSPLCLSLVLIVFFKKKCVCRPSWLAVLLCEVTIKSMLKRDWTKQRHYGKRAVGPALMAINVLVPFFVTVSDVNVVVVSVLMLIFLLVVLARTLKTNKQTKEM